MGLLGPYRLGPHVRSSKYGEVQLALSANYPEVLEVEFLTQVPQTRDARLAEAVLAGFNHVVGLTHRHLSESIGAGLQDGVPYLVRVHHLGLPLSRLLEDQKSLPISAAVGLLYSLCEVLLFLQQEGSRPGICAAGGFEFADLQLGFDGQFRFSGAGLKGLRIGEGSALQADKSAYRQLSTLLFWDEEGEPLEDLGTEISLERVLFELPRRFREECGLRQSHLARFLRAQYPDELSRQRAFFGLGHFH